MKRFVSAALAAVLVVGIGDLSGTAPARDRAAPLAALLGPASASAATVVRTTRRTPYATTSRTVVHTAPARYYAPPRIYPALPAGCTVVTINGVTAWRCGGVYYRAASGGYVVFTP